MKIDFEPEYQIHLPEDRIYRIGFINTVEKYHSRIRSFYSRNLKIDFRPTNLKKNLLAQKIYSN